MAPAAALDFAPGATWSLPDGATITDPITLGAVPAGAPVPPHPPPVALVVPTGVAHFTGPLWLWGPATLQGGGTLRVAASAMESGGLLPGVPSDNAFTVLQGTLWLDSSAAPGPLAWLGEVRTAPGTVLMGTSALTRARVAGGLQPGSPTQIGRLTLGQLWLADGAQTRIRIDARGQADQVFISGTAAGSGQLAGGLHIIATPGRWSPHQQWAIVQANPPAGGGAAPLVGQFARVQSSVPYLTPILHYAPDAVRLRWRYNAHGLNGADADWRSAILEDSRFPRDAALAHAAGGHALRLDLGVAAPVARATRLHFAYTGQHARGQHQHGAWLSVTRLF